MPILMTIMTLRLIKLSEIQNRRLISKRMRRKRLRFRSRCLRLQRISKIKLWATSLWGMIWSPMTDQSTRQVLRIGKSSRNANRWSRNWNRKRKSAKSNFKNYQNRRMPSFSWSLPTVIKRMKRKGLQLSKKNNEREKKLSKKFIRVLKTATAVWVSWLKERN